MADVTTSASRAELLRKLRRFTLSSERHGGAHTIAPSGDLDVATSSQLEAELLRVEATDATSIVLDLSGLDFIGATGLQVIVDADARSRAHANRLVLVRPSESVSRVFVICGMGDWAGVHRLTGRQRPQRAS
jgi:anti-sigma B factor antagonist